MSCRRLNEQSVGLLERGFTHLKDVGGIALVGLLICIFCLEILSSNKVKYVAVSILLI